MTEPVLAARGNTSWLTAFRAELGMRMEHRGWVIWYLIIDKLVRGVGLVAVAFVIYLNRRDFAGALDHVESFLGADAPRHFWQRASASLLESVANIGPRSMIAIAVGSLLYSVVEFAEAVGLLMRRRWAEYLVVIATGFFIPIEVYELVHHATLLKFGTLVINIAVVLYMVRQKHLFQFDSDLPPDEA